MSRIPRPSSCSISAAAAPGSDARRSGTGWIRDTPGPRHGSKHLPACSPWVMSIIPCRLIHYSRAHPRVVAWKRNIKKDFYTNISLKALLRLLARLKSSARGHVSTHLLGDRRSYSRFFRGAAHRWLMEGFQAFPLLLVITAAQASSLPLSGHVFGRLSSRLDLHCWWWPQNWRKTLQPSCPIREQGWLPLLSPSESRADSSPTDFTQPLCKGKSKPLWTRCFGEHESTDQHPAALSTLCSSFKKQSFKKNPSE